MFSELFGAQVDLEGAEMNRSVHGFHLVSRQ
jgi:hypothetical protein